MAVLDVNVVAADQQVWAGEAKRVIARTLTAKSASCLATSQCWVS